GIEQEEELTSDVVGVIEHDVLVLDEPLRAATRQPKLAGGQVAALLREDGADVQRPQLTDRREAEIAGGHAARQVARRRQPQRHVADLYALYDLAGPALVVDVDVVRRAEVLTPLVVVDVDVDPVRDRAAHLHAELDVGR